MTTVKKVGLCLYITQWIIFFCPELFKRITIQLICTQKENSLKKYRSMIFHDEWVAMDRVFKRWVSGFGSGLNACWIWIFFIFWSNFSHFWWYFKEEGEISKNHLKWQKFGKKKWGKPLFNLFSTHFSHWFQVAKNPNFRDPVHHYSWVPCLTVIVSKSET